MQKKAYYSDKSLKTLSVRFPRTRLDLDGGTTFRLGKGDEDEEKTLTENARMATANEPLMRKWVGDDDFSNLTSTWMRMMTMKRCFLNFYGYFRLQHGTNK